MQMHEALALTGERGCACRPIVKGDDGEFWWVNNDVIWGSGYFSKGKQGMKPKLRQPEMGAPVKFSYHVAEWELIEMPADVPVDYRPRTTAFSENCSVTLRNVLD